MNTQTGKAVNSYGVPSIDRMFKPFDRSAKYGFVSTGEVLTALESKGWLVDKIQVPKRGKDETTAKHLVRLINPTLKATLPDGLVPTINILNSHNATSALQLRLGIYRLVCANGLMVGDDWAGFKVIHRDSLVRDVTERVAELTDRIPAMAQNVSRMQSVVLDGDEAKRLITSIVNLRYPDIQVSDIKPFSVRPRREGDLEHDLFTVFNRAQELLIHGGVQFIGMDKQGFKTWKTTRKVGNVSDILRLNQEAYNEALSFLAAKEAA